MGENVVNFHIDMITLVSSIPRRYIFGYSGDTFEDYFCSWL
jgi:hypothetical protein